MIRKLTWPLAGICLLAAVIGLVSVFYQYPGRFVAGASFYGLLTAAIGYFLYKSTYRDNSDPQADTRQFVVVWLTSQVLAGLVMIIPGTHPFSVNWAYWIGGLVMLAVIGFIGFVIYSLDQVMDRIDAEHGY